MIDTLQDNLKRAWTQIRIWSGLISQRVRVELEVIRLLQRVKRIDERIEALYQIIGKRVVELKERHERNILKDEDINNAIVKIQTLTNEKESLLKQISEITELREETKS